MRSQAADDGQSAGVGHNVPRERQRHILVTTKAVTVIPKVVIGVHVLEVQIGFLSSLDDLVPQNNLRFSNDKFTLPFNENSCSGKLPGSVCCLPSHTRQ